MSPRILTLQAINSKDQESKPLRSNKTKDFKGQSVSTQAMAATNSLVSRDCPLTEKIVNNYIWSDTVLFFYQVPRFSGTTKNIRLKKTSFFQATFLCDMTFGAYFQHWGRQQLSSPFCPSLSQHRRHVNTCSAVITA